MFNKVWIINIVLALCTIFFSLEAYTVWSEKPIDLSAIGKMEEPAVKPVKKINSISLPRESSFDDITEKNLFSFLRTSEKEQKQEKEGEDELALQIIEVKVGGKDVLLYGVVLAGEYTKALITNVGDKKETARPVAWVGVGDDIGDGFIVAEIQEESVIFEKDNTRYETPLYDEKKDRRQAARKSTSKPQKQTQPTIVTADSEKKVSPQKAEVQRSESKSVVKTTPDEKKKNSSVTQVEENEEYVIIDTPFGKIKRRKK